MTHTNLDTLASHMFTIGRIMREQIHQGKEGDFFSFLEFKTLAIVSEKKEPSMRDISSSLHITSPSTTQIIDRLVKNKELVRIPDPKDRRIIRLKITPVGKKHLDKQFTCASEKIKKILGALSEKQKIELTKIFTTIINNHNNHEHSA